MSAENSFDPLIDMLDTGIIILDHNARIIGLNKWVEIAAGLSRKSALGRELGEICIDYFGCFFTWEVQVLGQPES